MKNLMLSALLACVLAFSCAGCSRDGKDENNAAFVDPQIDTIEILSHGYPVSIASSADEEISLSIAGIDDNIAPQNCNILSVSVPEPKACLNLSSVPTLTILLPEHQYETIVLTSTGGDVVIRNINVLNLTVSNGIGNISIAGLIGEVFASTTLGKVDSIHALVVMIDNGGLGASISGTVEDDSKQIEICMDLGAISIK